MGYGDEILGSGMARGAAARGKRIAFGDGRRIIWGPTAADIFAGNPNVAAPGTEGRKDLEWIEHYPSRRAYNRNGGTRWIWNYDFKARPGELFFRDDELNFASNIPSGFVLVEPNVPWRKSVAINKQWSVERYQHVADSLIAAGHRVVQLMYDGHRHRLEGVELVGTMTFRSALAALSRAALYIGPEGGMHHGAAALGVKAVVIFGGFIPPQVTGYDFHANLSAGGEACGSMQSCEHCRRAMDAISADQVYQAAQTMLSVEIAA